MSEPFIGEIKMFGSNFAPRGYAFCDGQILAISQNEALFSLIGTIYGGDGRTTFGLPDLRGRSPKHPGSGPGLNRVQLGQKGGREEHTLTVVEMPSHDHPHSHPHTHAATLHVERRVADETKPKGNMLAISKADTEMYHTVDAGRNDAALARESITLQEDSTTGVGGQTGGGQSFSIDSPYQAVNFIIALEGIFPSRS